MLREAVREELERFFAAVEELAEGSSNNWKSKWSKRASKWDAPCWKESSIADCARSVQPRDGRGAADIANAWWENGPRNC
jgi:hypothetical protein